MINNIEQKYALYLSGKEAYLKGDNEKLQRILNHADLGNYEKNLLKVRLLYKKMQYDEAAVILNSLTSTSCSFLLGEKSFLLSNLNSYAGDFQKALQFSLSAFKHYQDAGYKAGLFRVSYNLYIDYKACGDLEKAADYLKFAEAASLNEQHQLLLSQNKAFDLACQGQTDLALNEAQNTLNLLGHGSPAEQAHARMLIAEIFFRAAKLDEALLIYDDLAQNKYTRLPARVLFDKIMVQSQISESKNFLKLPSKPNRIKLSEQYSMQWDLLKAIQHGEQTQLAQLWQKLHLLAPGYFLETPFSFSSYEAGSPFAQFISKIRNKKKAPLSSQMSSKKVRELLEILSSTPYPLNKVELIEKLWQQPYHPDLEARFYKLIQRAKKEGFEIKNISRAYQLVA